MGIYNKVKPKKDNCYKASNSGIYERIIVPHKKKENNSNSGQ